MANSKTTFVTVNLIEESKKVEPHFHSKTTFVTVNQAYGYTTVSVRIDSKTTFVTVNNTFKTQDCSVTDSKTTFVTVNPKEYVNRVPFQMVFKNNLCYC